jgi:hypothetical protein
MFGGWYLFGKYKYVYIDEVALRYPTITRWYRILSLQFKSYVREQYEQSSDAVYRLL